MGHSCQTLTQRRTDGTHQHLQGDCVCQEHDDGESPIIRLCSYKVQHLIIAVSQHCFGQRMELGTLEEGRERRG